MKTSISDILKNSVLFGLIFAAISIVISLIMYILDVNMFSIPFAVFSFVVILIGIPATMGILGCNNLRAKFATDRTIAYADALVTCLVIFLIGFLLSNIYSYIFNTYLDPAYLKAQTQKLVEMLEKYNLPQDKIDETIEKTKKGFQIGRMLMTSLITSAVMALILSLFVRKKDKFDDKII